MTMSVADEQQRPVDAGAVTVGRHRYLRAPVPVVFPVHDEVEVGEHKLHLELKTLLFEILKLAFADRAIIGCDQFVYWDPTSPSACLAPDAFVRMGGPDEIFSTWKVWERGAPHVAVEIISDHDRHEDIWNDKLDRYRKLGVGELVCFDPTPRAPRAGMLRVWDRVEHDLVEREISADCAASSVLPGYWLVREAAGLGPSLRLSRDERGAQLYLSSAEASRATAEAAAARIRELEAELARRQG